MEDTERAGIIPRSVYSVFDVLQSTCQSGTFLNLLFLTYTHKINYITVKSYIYMNFFTTLFFLIFFKFFYTQVIIQ